MRQICFASRTKRTNELSMSTSFFFFVDIQLSHTILVHNQWKQKRVIDILYWNDWNIIGYKNRYWSMSLSSPHDLTVSAFFVPSILSFICQNVVFPLSFPLRQILFFSLGTAVTRLCYHSHLCLADHLINMRNEIPHVWKWFDFQVAQESGEFGNDDFLIIWWFRE